MVQSMRGAKFIALAALTQIFNNFVLNTVLPSSRLR